MAVNVILAELNELFQHYFVLPGYREDKFSSDSVIVRYWRERDHNPRRMECDRLRVVITSDDPEGLDGTTLFVRQIGGNVNLLGAGPLRKGTNDTDHWVNIGGIPSSEGELFLSVATVRNPRATA
ncbi:hypothetical protein HYZ78_04175 [Candidatus Microgenomates bacterium]|nr:hypothetical protein [Candidatus Microgenomates bacterium]